MAARPTGGRDRRICVAQIGAAHGLKGEVRLRSFTQDPAAIARYGALEAEDRSRSFEIESLREAKDVFVARLRGIDDRDAAEALRNMRLYVPRSRLPEAGPDEFYHADLIGLAAVLKDGAAFGELIAVENFGAGDIIEIRCGDGTTVMLPFTETAVPEIDIAGGRIVVDPPVPVDVPPLNGDGRSLSRGDGERGGVNAKGTHNRSRSARSTSPLRGEEES